MATIGKSSIDIKIILYIYSQLSYKGQETDGLYIYTYISKIKTCKSARLEWPPLSSGALMQSINVNFHDYKTKVISCATSDYNTAPI